MLGIQCLCHALTTPDGHDADAFRALVNERFHVTFGAGPADEGPAFRIGHQRDVNEAKPTGVLTNT